MSRARQRTGRLIKERTGAEERLLRSAALLKGSFFEQYRKCGKTGCRCERGKRHGPYPYLVVGKGAKRKLTYVAAKDYAGIKMRSENSKEFAALLAKRSKLNEKIKSGINDIRRILESIP